MTTYFSALLVSTSLVACGSKSPPATAPAPAQDHADPDHTGSGSAVATPDPTPTPTPTSKPADPPPPDPAKVKADLLAIETSAWQTAKPVFDKTCASCHTKAGKKSAKKKLAHMDLDTYPIGGHHTGTIGYAVREVLGLSGKKATMPYDRPGSVRGDDLAKITAWTDAWEVAEKGGAHPPHGLEKDDD